MALIREFLSKLYQFLVDKSDINNNIIRKHSRALQELGDLSFPLDIKNWHNLVDLNKVQSYKAENIFEYSGKTKDVNLHILRLVSESKKWPIVITKCVIIKDSVHIWLERLTAFSIVINNVIDRSDRYGCNKLEFINNFHIEADVTSRNTTEITSTELKLIMVEKFINRLLQFNNCIYSENQTTKECHRVVIVTNKSTNTTGDVKILCGAVLNENRIKSNIKDASELYKKQTINMRLMAEHKYGVRITSKPGWQEFFQKLGEAAVTIDLLQNKPHHTTTIHLNDHIVSKSKGAAFILYNCARLATLFKEHDKKVKANVYPSLPSVDKIDYGLLIQPEEWELLYVYVLQFPLLVESCIKDIEQGRINPHYLVSMLSKLSSLFSVYYRRVRILTEPRSHLFPVLHARIYLLKAVECVFHNALHLLGIQPVKQM